MKKISSWVRPGVREMRARFLRPVSALSRLDLPTLERPASAISVPRIFGSETADPAAAANCHSPANRRRPASISLAVNFSIPGTLNEIAGEYPAIQNVLSEERQKKTLFGYCCGFFFTNNALILSINSILAPCLRMMMLCCTTDSELFQAQ